MDRIRWTGWVLAAGVLGACSSHHAGRPDAGDAAPVGTLGTTPNLIVNGDAEAAAGSSRGSVVVASIPGWTTSGNANVVTYGASSGYATVNDPGPADRGANLFAGGPNDIQSVFTQHIDLGAYAAFIARGNVTFTLSAYLGGYAAQEDNAVLTVTFLGNGQQSVGAGATLGPVSAADRNGNTALLARTISGAVPVQASSLDLLLTMTRTEGSANDGYADDLVLTLTDMPQTGDAGADANGPPTDANASDGSTVDSGADGGGPDGLSSETRYLLQQLDLARRGLPADLDGDGKAEWTSRISNGLLVYFEVDQNGDGFPEGVYMYDPATGSGSLEVDEDQNGVVEHQVTFTSNPSQSVELTDHDLDGIVDFRRTQLFEPTQNRMTVTLETDPDQNGTFDLVSTSYESSKRELCGKPTGAMPPDDNCDAFASFPTSGDAIGPPPIAILTTNNQGPDSSGNCNLADAQRLKTAADCAMGKGTMCMDVTNLFTSLQLRASLVGGSVVVGCGNTCKSSASTSHSCPPWPLGQCQAEISVNVSNLAMLGEEDACVLILHELLHWVDMPDAGDGDGGHGDGVDQVYACGRYCAGCVNKKFSPPQCPITRNTDCATCAGTKVEKRRCGTKTEASATQENYSVCHASLSCPSKKCDEPIGLNVFACDGALMDSHFFCCQTCPSDCNGSNDIACPTTLPAPEDHCDIPPPACP